MKQEQRIMYMELNRIRLQTPVGKLILESKEDAISVIRLENATDALVPDTAPKGSALEIAAREMREYFEGKRSTFSFPMNPEGTEFQKNVWKELLNIPYGETRTYGEIARKIGNPNGARAVGGACNRNPLWIAVPCHRVIGSTGALTGYALGTGMKQALLLLEQKNRIK